MSPGDLLGWMSEAIISVRWYWNIYVLSSHASSHPWPHVEPLVLTHVATPKCVPLFKNDSVAIDTQVARCLLFFHIDCLKGRATWS